VAFATFALLEPELDDEPDALDELLELDDPQAASARAAPAAAVTAASFAMRGRSRLSMFTGCCISLLVSVLGNADVRRPVS
jgi:hypothetical protein